MSKTIMLLLFLLLVIAATAGCKQNLQNRSDRAEELILATTTSTYDSGLLDYFLPFFEKKYDYKVKVISLGTGQALELGKNGDADVVLVHAKKTELEMVAQGHFVDRHDVMYNDFIIVGPEEHRAEINDVTSINQLFALLAGKEFAFISRGDDSGTHKKEWSLWEAAGISPQGSWYINSGSGMGDTLRMADEMDAYTLTDRATFLSLRDKLDLAILFAGDPPLFNQYGIMAVNPENYLHTNYEGAMLLIDFFVSKEGQQLISSFKPYGETLFYPNAE